jgi:hypothetical protein
VRFEFESAIVLFYFSFTFVLFGESCLLVSWCAGGRCDMACSDKDRGRSRTPGAEDRGWSHRSGTRWSGSRETFVSGLALKPLGRFSSVWPQNRW